MSVRGSVVIEENSDFSGAIRKPSSGQSIDLKAFLIFTV